MREERRGVSGHVNRDVKEEYFSFGRNNMSRENEATGLHEPSTSVCGSWSIDF